MSSSRHLARLVAAIAACWCSLSVADPAASGLPLRCGWFDNPSPGNAWLYDRDGEWTIGIQGSHQSEGEWPKFKASHWVRTGAGNHGHGCTCLKAQVDDESREVKRIVAYHARPLSACRKDTALKGKEPANPLK